MSRDVIAVVARARRRVRVMPLTVDPAENGPSADLFAARARSPAWAS